MGLGFFYAWRFSLERSQGVTARGGVKRYPPIQGRTRDWTEEAEIGRSHQEPGAIVMDDGEGDCHS